MLHYLYSWLAILALLIFLFAVLVVLLNILIAQLSDTYAEVKNKAASTLEETWAHAIRTIELTSKFRVSNHGETTLFRACSVAKHRLQKSLFLAMKIPFQ